MTAISRRAWAALVTLAAACGLVVALYHYLAPITGVTGTPGALLVVVSSALITLLGLAWLSRPHRGLPIRILVLVAASGTLLAALLLHEFWLVAAMAVVLLAGMVDMATAHRGVR